MGDLNHGLRINADARADLLTEGGTVAHEQRETQRHGDICHSLATAGG
jgi:hypothetical protein